MENQKQGSPEPDQETNTSLDQAVAAHSRGDLALAERIYLRVLESVPTQPAALHFLGILLHQRDRSDAGIEMIRQSIALQPGQAAWLNDLGNVLTERDLFRDAAGVFREALDVAPYDANIWTNFGSVLQRLERWDEAEAAYRQAIALDAEFVTALSNCANLLSLRGRANDAAELFARAYILGPREGKLNEVLGLAYCRLGRTAEAAEVYRQWSIEEPDNPIAIHLHAACSKVDVPARAADAYLEKAFDEFAASFDEKLVDLLSYRGPELIGMALAQVVQSDGTLDVLDGGCGTGLCGPILAPFARKLVGVDLSAGMLGMAHQRGLYAELVKQELTSYLRERPSTFDLVAMADTLIYFGTLDEIFTATYASIRSGGHYAFTVETGEEEEVEQCTYDIGSHGRYRHAAAYVHTQLARCGFVVRVSEAAILREEHTHPVYCRLIVAAKR